MTIIPSVFRLSEMETEQFAELAGRLGLGRRAGCDDFRWVDFGFPRLNCTAPNATQFCGPILLSLLKGHINEHGIDGTIAASEEMLSNLRDWIGDLDWGQITSKFSTSA